MYEKITIDTILNDDSVVRRKVGEVYEYFTVTGYDTNTQKYLLESFEGKAEAHDWQVVTSTDDLIANFELQISK